MRRYLAFIGIGSIFATVEEFLTVVVLRRDIGSYIFTLLILFPAFLTFVFFSSRLLDRAVRLEAWRQPVHYFVYGFIGLMIEWFLIGLAPWSNPDANPLLMGLFQLGMFSFWATVGFAPRLFTDSAAPARRIRRSILRFYIPFFAVTYLIGLVVPDPLRFAAIIGLIVFGYSFLNLYYFGYFSLRLSEHGEKIS